MCKFKTLFAKKFIKISLNICKTIIIKKPVKNHLLKSFKYLL